MIISRTPFRISFFGGGTDYPSWYKVHGGSVLATTIDKYSYLTCRYLPPFFEHRIRVVYSKIENCQRIDEITHPAVKAVLRYLAFDRGVEIHHDGDLPARSGMGSSSSFTVGLLHALYALKGAMPSKEHLARESIYIEQDVLEETVGSQDQVLAAHGGFNHVTFMPNGEISIRPMTLLPERIRELNAHLMLFYTGIVRRASEVADTYVTDLPTRERQMKLISDFVDESISILSGSRDLEDFGKLLHEGWKAKRSLSDTVSNRYVDDMYRQALAAGAWGGKLTGAGGGGFMLLFAPPDTHMSIRERLAEFIHVPFRFEFSGSQIIFFDQEEDHTAAEQARSAQVIKRFRHLGETL